MSYLPFDTLSSQLPLEADFLFHPQPADDSKPQNSLFSRLLNRSTDFVKNIRSERDENPYMPLREESEKLDDKKPIILSEEEKPLLVDTLKEKDTTYYRCLAFHPTAPLMASGSNNHTMSLWKLTKKINLK